MNTIIFASLLLSAVTAHAYPYLSHPEASSAYAYDSHGHLLSAHDSHGSGVYGSHGLQKDSGIAVHDSHAISSHADRKAHEVDSDHYNKYKNVGAYSHEKGDGFEKTYHYEKVNGHHDIVADHDALKTSYGNHGAKSYHDSRDHGASGHSSYGSYNKYGANSFGSHGHLDSAYGKTGHGHSKHSTSGHLLGGYPVVHGLEGYTTVLQPIEHGVGGYTAEHRGYPVVKTAEYSPIHGSSHGYSKVYFKGPGYGYHY